MIPAAQPRPATTKRGPRRGLRRTLVLLLLLMALVVLSQTFDLPTLLRQALDSVSTLGLWGWALFIVLYIVATVLLVPGSALTLGAGAVFGVFRGVCLVSIASTLAATAAFLIGRYLAREAITRKFANHPQFAAIDRAVAEEGWKIVLLTRLSPVFPFTLLNYGFGLTQVRLAHYVLASWIGMIPGTVMYVYLGSLAQALGGRTRTLGEWVLYGVGLVATVLVTLLVTRIARQALTKQIASPRQPSEPPVSGETLP